MRFLAIIFAIAFVSSPAIAVDTGGRAGLVMGQDAVQRMKLKRHRAARPRPVGHCSGYPYVQTASGRCLKWVTY